MTKQQLFDKVSVHLLTQNKKSETPTSGTCLYRAGELRCAVGVLIPDDIYHSDIEGFGVVAPLSQAVTNERMVFAKWLRKTFSPTQQRMLFRLQRVHDQFEPSDWWWQLAEVAKDYEVSTKAMDKVK